MSLKSTITAWDIEDLNEIMEHWEKYSNSIIVTLSDTVLNYGIRGLKYGRINSKCIHYDYYEDEDWIHHYIANFPNWKVKDFCWKTIDEAWNNCSTHLSSVYDVRIAPDGVFWGFNKFLLDALKWNLHWLSLK